MSLETFRGEGPSRAAYCIRLGRPLIGARATPKLTRAAHGAGRFDTLCGSVFTAFFVGEACRAERYLCGRSKTACRTSLTSYDSTNGGSSRSRTNRVWRVRFIWKGQAHSRRIGFHHILVSLRPLSRVPETGKESATRVSVRDIDVRSPNSS